MKLWDKGYELDHTVERFMTGDDPLLDQRLIPYDCLGSIAHVEMLTHIGILTPNECALLCQELNQIKEQAEQGLFNIESADEDVHTAVENAITEKLGDLGQKMHTGRSRNDQVLVDLRLYMKDQINLLFQAMHQLCLTLVDFAEQHQAIPIPGRTHTQRAMPSSLGLWSGAMAESLCDDRQLLEGALHLIDQSPLGSAASYGVSLPIDREFCAAKLRFAKVQNNVLYVNNSRGKFEAIVLHACTQIMNTLSKCAADLILFSIPELGYLTLPEKFCPGSSLMPQKRNPCPLELIRAKAATVNGYLMAVLEICRGLPSGYHRDFQETKRPLMLGLEITVDSLVVMNAICKELTVNSQTCLQAFSSELYATDYALELVKAGMPFRQAYRYVGMNPEKVPLLDPVENILSKTHTGATGNLGLKDLRKFLEDRCS
jgi:argininosuccinate lyase